ncbi:MAG: right-handed parallel beta-helix repeat-containing protein [Planctomycetota bacterium]|nr:right-handed parallel beta-helix repeat-containing protein [Planctomycetota bacterium]
MSPIDLRDAPHNNGESDLEDAMKYLTILIASFLLISHASADVLDVPGEYLTIQSAIQAAVDGDTIAIATGSYPEFGIDPSGLAITIEGATNIDGSPAVTIDGQQADAVLICQSGEDTSTIFRNLVITNGDSNTGGGLFLSNGSSPRFENCGIEGNSSARGGGVYCINNCNPHFQDCWFDSNQADIDGGGFYSLLNCDPVLVNCTFTNNQVSSSQFAFGGGMYNRDNSNPQLTNCLFRNNQAISPFSSGGAIANTESSPMLIDCVLESNTTGGAGGGMSNTGASCQPVLTGCLILGNSSTNGGGLSFSLDATGQVTDCEVSTNTATNGGGLFSVSGGNPSVSGTLLCGNSPDQVNGDWTDQGSNEILESCPDCPGDATGDGYVDVNDVLYVISAWDTPDPNADFDNDGLVDADDVLILLSHYGETCD